MPSFPDPAHPPHQPPHSAPKPTYPFISILPDPSVPPSPHTMPPRIIKNDYTAPRPLAASLLSRRPIPTPTGPPTAGAAVAAGSSSTAEDPDSYLERAEKEWNERVDGEVEGLAAGPRGLVELISVRVPISRPPVVRPPGRALF